MLADTDHPSALRVAVFGGHDPAALERVIAGVPHGEGIALVVACPTSNGELAAKLREGSRPVTEVRGRARVERDRVFIVPSDHVGWFQRSELFTELAPGSVAPIDRLLRTAADELGRDTTGVILAGRGTDGVIGIKRLKEAGGLTIAQRTDGDDGELPRAAIATGMIDLVLGADEIGSRLSALTREPGLIAPDSTARAEAPETLGEIIALLRTRTGHDFAAYKRATLYRRVARRMQVCRCGTAQEYQAYLHDHPAELSNLLRDFLISVTNFFRDREAFDALERSVIPRLFAGRKAEDQVRVWVPGCATGEEAYSIAILLAEHAATLPSPPQCQVFATDIDDTALSEARAGVYPTTIALDVSPQRIARFFIEDGGQLRVNDALRERILFSPHNLLRDPPFSRLDLISCRNLLIYLNRDAQDRVFNVFHFSLRPDGYLFLGSSESAEGSSLFTPLDARSRIFSRRLAPSTLGISPFIAHRRWETPLPPAPVVARERDFSAGQLHHQLLEKYAPPSILVNAELEVIHVSETAGRYLQIGGGEPSRDLIRLIHPGLRGELRTLIHAARQAPHDGVPARIVEIEDGDRKRLIELRVRVTESPELGPGGLLVMLDERESFAGVPVTRQAGDFEPVVREIEEELRSTRAQLRLTVDQYETSVEELKASNEELQAINEELRSATEELETGKEELQSVNEELITLNQELKLKLEELSHANADLLNLMTSTEIAVVFLDRKLNIKRFTPRLQQLFNVIPTDVGRPFAHLTHTLDRTFDLLDAARSVLETLRTVEREIRTQNQRIYLARLLPYRSLEDRIEGIVITFVDVTDVRRAMAAQQLSQAALAQSEERLQFALRSAPIVIIGHAPDGEATWGHAMGTDLGGAKVLELFAPGHAERYTTAIREALADRSPRRVELDLVIDGQLRTYDFRIEASETGAHGIAFDITPSKLAEIALVDADRRKDEFLATISHELRNPLTPLKVALEVMRVAKDPTQLSRSREIMERQVAMLEGLVNELMDLARITQGRITLDRQPVGVTELVEAALEVMRPSIAERGHRLQVHLPETAAVIVGDRGRLIQVLTNLLGNAVKYTPRGGDIELVASVNAQRKRLVIHVRDTGMGIAPDMLARIFDIFVQSRDAQGRSQGGLGIGLNLVRRLVALHGGTVTATSDGPDRGSEFVVDLPLA